MTLPTLQLKPQADRRLRKGHLWIYSNEVDVVSTPLKLFEAGQQVEVRAAKGASLGIATVNPNNLICARLISRDAGSPLDRSLLVQRLRQAQSLRERCFSQPYYRLVYGDSDLLPGLVVDRFAGVLVVQIASAGMERLREDIVAALVEVVNPTGILLANEHSARELEHLPLYTELAYGEVPEHVELIENNTRFLAPVRTGQKTGWFYDHRLNRARLQQFVVGKRVLDVFSYIGGWGLAAAQAGAASVVCVDASESALQGVQRNAEHNGFKARVSVRHGKAIAVMKAMIEDGLEFDVVVLDPPAFIKKRKDHKAGLAAYRHINELGMRLLGPDGILVSGSCSMHLATQELEEVIQGAARHLDRHAQLIARGSQGPDHPVHSAIAETEYLKALFYRVYQP